MQKSNPKKELRPPQEQDKPGIEADMKPHPVAETQGKPSGKLFGKVALITGGDSGIGRAVALLFAKEGADVAISYLNEEEDARGTADKIEECGHKCLLLPGDISSEEVCKKVVAQTHERFKRIDILINNAAVHWEQKSLEDISAEQLMKTFSTNVFSMFWITQAALQYMPEGSAIVNTTSVTAYRGSAALIDYASTKAAIVGFTRSLAQSLIEKKIRVNAVAPGPIWTPLVVSTFDAEKVAQHGSDAPMKRAGEPAEVAPSFLFLACNEMSSYITGQVLHPNGGEIVNG